MKIERKRGTSWVPVDAASQVIEWSMSNVEDAVGLRDVHAADAAAGRTERCVLRQSTRTCRRSTGSRLTTGTDRVSAATTRSQGRCGSTCSGRTARRWSRWRTSRRRCRQRRGGHVEQAQQRHADGGVEPDQLGSRRRCRAPRTTICSSATSGQSTGLNFVPWRTVIWSQGEEASGLVPEERVALKAMLSSGDMYNRKNLIMAGQEVARIHDVALTATNGQVADQDFVLNYLRAEYAGTRRRRTTRTVGSGSWRSHRASTS